MYGINGEKNLHEETLEYLSGYRNSKPVRTGNAAYLQKQNEGHSRALLFIATLSAPEFNN